MNRVRWTLLAVDDLKQISRYVESQSNLPTANRICRSIYDAIQTLRRFPERGRLGFEEGTRELVVEAYVVNYRVLGAGTVQVIRIWHAAQERAGR